MSFPEIETEISSPSQLVALLRDVKECVAQGRLRQLNPPSGSLASKNLEEIPDTGPWPDYVEVYFEDPRGARYKLSVETYHGAGGSWRRV